MMRALILFCFTVVLSVSQTYGQLKNFGTGAKLKPQPVFLVGIYGYGDLIREYGAGFQYQLFAKYNLDVSAYLIDPKPYFKTRIRQWDYYDLKGYGFSFKPKYQIGKLSRFYVGLNLSYESLQHNKVWVEYYGGKGTEITHNLETAHGRAYTIGFTVGDKLNYKRLFLEPFFGIGITSSVLNKTIYAYDRQTYYSQTLPYSVKDNLDFFQMNIGLKIGFSFLKSKKHQAIDQKFDRVYIPKTDSLINYFKTADYRHKSLWYAYRRTLQLNRSILYRYNHNYADTATFYRKVDLLFLRIDELIKEGNR